MREMHWSYEELLATPDEVVGAALRVLSYESQKQDDEMRRSGGGRPTSSANNAANYRPRADPPAPPGPPPPSPTGPMPYFPSASSRP